MTDNKLSEQAAESVKLCACYALQTDRYNGFIPLKDEVTMERVLELLNGTKELLEKNGGKKIIENDIQDLLQIADYAFLGMKEIKGGFMLGILLYKNNIEFMSLKDIMGALAKLAVTYQDDDC